MRKKLAIKCDLCAGYDNQACVQACEECDTHRGRSLIHLETLPPGFNPNGVMTAKASLDDAIYVITPQGKVIDLPAGATPVDFAYTLHTDLGHRCRGAKVDGRMVPLDTPLASGQRVEIIAAKSGGPSRDCRCRPREWRRPRR